MFVPGPLEAFSYVWLICCYQFVYVLAHVFIVYRVFCLCSLYCQSCLGHSKLCFVYMAVVLCGYVCSLLSVSFTQLCVITQWYVLITYSNLYLRLGHSKLLCVFRFVCVMLLTCCALMFCYSISVYASFVMFCLGHSKLSVSPPKLPRHIGGTYTILGCYCYYYYYQYYYHYYYECHYYNNNNYYYLSLSLLSSLWVRGLGTSLSEIRTSRRRSKVKRTQVLSANISFQGHNIVVPFVLFICLFRGRRLHQKSTPQKPSWIFSGIFRWTFSGIFQWVFTCQRYFPKDCHFPSGSLLEMSNGVLEESSTDISFV